MTLELIDDTDPLALMRQGAALLKEDAHSAVNFLQAVVKQHPENPHLLSMLGQAADVLSDELRLSGELPFGEYKRLAAESYARASDIDPSGYLNAQLAATCFHSVRDDRGFTYALRATQLERGNFRGWFKLADFYNRLGDINRAAVCYRNTLRLNPEHRMSILKLDYMRRPHPAEGSKPDFRILDDPTFTPTI